MMTFFGQLYEAGIRILSLCTVFREQGSLPQALFSEDARLDSLLASRPAENNRIP